MSKIITVAKLSELGVYELRTLGRKMGVQSPTSKKKDEIISQIMAIQEGQLAPVSPNKRGRPIMKYIAKNNLQADTVVDGFYTIPNIDASFSQGTFSEAESVQVKGIMGIADIEKRQRLVFYTIERKNGSLILVNTAEIGVATQLAAKYNLQAGDCIEGLAKQLPYGNASVLVDISTINGISADKHTHAKGFDKLTREFPKTEIAVKTNGGKLLLGQQGAFFSKREDAWENFKKYVVNFCNASSEIYVLLLDIPDEYLADFNDYLSEKVKTSRFMIVSTKSDTYPACVVQTADLFLGTLKRKAENGQNPILLIYNFSHYAKSACSQPLVLDVESVHKAKGFLGSAASTKEAGSLTIYTFLSHLSNSEQIILPEITDKASVVINI